MRHYVILRPLSRTTVTPLPCPVRHWMRDQVQAWNSEYQVQARDSEYRMMQTLARLSTMRTMPRPYHMTGLPAPLNDVSQGRHIRANVPRRRRGLQNRVWWVRFPTVRASSALLAMPTAKRLVHHSTARRVGSTAGRERCSSDAEPSAAATRQRRSYKEQFPRAERRNTAGL